MKVELTHLVGPAVTGLAFWGYYTGDKLPLQIFVLLGLWLTYHALFLKGKLKPLQDEYARGGMNG